MVPSTDRKIDKYAKISELARRRGFFWQSSEIYGGVGGFIDLGPLGVYLKNNIINKWREIFIKKHQDFIVEIETPIIMPEKVFIASGHVEHFTDYIVECKKCHRKFRADHLLEEELNLKGLERLSAEELTQLIIKYNVKCPECGGELSSVQKFNLLFKTTIGPYKYNIGYARPETAQGMFVSFIRVYEAMRRKMPLGIAQIGKVLRNEIAPRQGLIRLREFTIMEIELFYDPKNPKCDLLEEVADIKLRLLTEEDVAKGKDEPRIVTVKEAIDKKYIMSEWNAYFMALAKIFVNELGIPDEKQMFIAKLPDERAHYAAQTYDQVVWTERWGWIEVSGHAYRTDYDLKRHIKYSGHDLRAYRLLDKPIKIKRAKVTINKALIGKTFKSKAKIIFDEISKKEPDFLVKELERKGYIEIAGIKLGKEYFNINYVEETIHTERFIPHVAEPSFGLERVLYVTLEYAYREKDGRVILSLPRDLAPIQVAVFPIITKEIFVKKAKEVYEMLKNRGFMVTYDEEGSIGRRYARVDEIGVPFAITIDSKTLEDNTVTVRDRDSWKQIRIPISYLIKFIRYGLEKPRTRFEELVEEFKKEYNVELTWEK